jgi:hypothetical protein
MFRHLLITINSRQKRVKQGDAGYSLDYQVDAATTSIVREIA